MQYAAAGGKHSPLECDQHPEGDDIFHRQGALRASSIEFFQLLSKVPACGRKLQGLVQHLPVEQQPVPGRLVLNWR